MIAKLVIMDIIKYLLQGNPQKETKPLKEKYVYCYFRGCMFPVKFIEVYGAT